MVSRRDRLKTKVRFQSLLVAEEWKLIVVVCSLHLEVPLDAASRYSYRPHLPRPLPCHVSRRTFLFRYYLLAVANSSSSRRARPS